MGPRARPRPARRALSCARRHAQNALPKRACPTRACPKREQDRPGRAPDRRLHGCKSRWGLTGGLVGASGRCPHAHRCRVARAWRTGVLHRPAAHLWVPPFQVGGLQQRPVDVRVLRKDLVATVPGVHDVQVVHAWSHTRTKPMITLHALIADVNDGDRIASAIKAALCKRTRAPRHHRDRARRLRGSPSPADLIARVGNALARGLP